MNLLDSKGYLKIKNEIRGPKTALAIFFTHVEIGPRSYSDVVLCDLPSI
jgi:hypothetical protein